MGKTHFRGPARPRLLHATDNAGDHLRRVQQGLRSQMSVTLGHAGLGVPKKSLNHVKRHALVHKEAGERMAQIMQSDVSQARTPPDAVPWTEQTGELRREDVGARRIARRRSQQGDRRSIERNGSRFARFRHWHQQGSPLPVHILPPGSGHLTAPGSGKQQEHDGFGGDLVFVRVDRADEALGLLSGQKPLPVNLRNHGETCRRVRAYARHVPLSGKIEDIAQEDQDSIGGSSGISLGPHVVDQPRYVLAGNLVEGETTEGGQDVDAQDGFIGFPASFAGLGMGQITVADELVEGWDGPQCLAASLRVGAKQRLGERRAGRPSCLLDGEDAGRAELELSLPAISVEITLVEGLAPRRSDFRARTLSGLDRRSRGEGTRAATV